MTLFSLSLLVSMFFMFSKAPLMMALLVVTQTILVTASIYSVLSTSWLSFILFMIFVSAMMVMFVYVSSLASNDFFVFSHPSSMFTVYSPFLLLPVVYLTLSSQPSSVKSQSSLSDMDLGPMMPYKLYMAQTSSFTLFLIIYLLVALIVVAKISMSYKGALRAINP